MEGAVVKEKNNESKKYREGVKESMRERGGRKYNEKTKIGMVRKQKRKTWKSLRKQ